LRGRDLIRIAEAIYRRKKSEGWYRIGIHAVYYGTIWELWNFFERKGYKIRGKERPHKRIRNILEKEKFFHAVKLLEKLADLRILSDYNPNAKVTRSDLSKALKLSKLILKEVGL